LPQHTTLLITAEQVGLLDHYFQLARFLSPSLVIVEDVDLIARAREQMSSPCEEVLLNKLLNEMDGLREDADVIFILTTNRPDQLEPALASRPGRIDQAIEFPLPDEQGRTKLVKLYSRGLELAEELVELVVRKTKGASPAFIKELMRRAAQFQCEMAADGKLQQSALDGALEEMVFSGGTLNLKLLGGSSTELAAAVQSRSVP
jgi:ATP-dependent 26S proteasome regulatory subunit